MNQMPGASVAQWRRRAAPANSQDSSRHEKPNFILFKKTLSYIYFTKSLYMFSSLLVIT